MRLHLSSAYAVHPGLDTLMESALLDTSDRHSLCESAEQADAIVFVENTQFDDVMFKQLRTHDLVKRYPDKVYMFNEMDRPWTVLPGVYTCMSSKHYDPAQHSAFAYLSTPNSFIRDIFAKNTQRQWLYTFMGAMSHASRRRVVQLKDERGYVKDTSGFNVWNTSPEQMQERARDYANILGSSQYVLCPRGIGTSSIRLYETLEAGRAPVIIADQWVPPDASDWSFAVQIKENRISSIPEILRACENEAEERGLAAREAWLAHYAPASLFNTLGNAIENIVINASMHAPHSTSLPWNKWMASSGLITRTAVQRLRGQR